jgi:PAS domain S-box-containing protein
MTSQRFDEDPMASGQPASLQLYQENTLRALLVSISLTGPVVTGGVYLRDGPGPLMWVGCALTFSVWLLLLAFRMGHRRSVAGALVYLLIVASAAAIAAHGTVRSMASLVMLAAVVGAGTFLSRRNMIGSAALGVGLLALLNLAENAGHLPQPQTQTGWAVWVTQTAVLLSLVVTVNFGRKRLLDAFHAQHQALSLAEQATAELSASEARGRALFSNNPAASLVESVEKKAVTDVNAAFLELFGYRRDELVGHALPDLWADPGEQLGFHAKLRALGRVSGLQAKGRRKDGQVFDALIYAEVVQHGDERLVVTMVIDVSAEKASRRELERSRERFTKAFNFSPLGMTITRLSDGRFIEVNSANERVLGYSQSDYEGKTSVEAGVWLSEEDRMAYVNALQRDGRLVSYETRMRSKSGEPVDVRVWAEIIDIDGEPCALSFTLNVAEEKRREVMLLNVAEGVSGQTGEAFFLSLVDHLTQAIGADGVMVGELDEHRRLQTLSLVWDGQRLPNQNHDLSFTLCEKALQQREMLMLDNREPGTMPLMPPFRDELLQTYVGLPLRDEDGSPVGLLTAVWRKPPPLRDDLQALLTIFASRCNAELVRLRRDREILRLQATLEKRVNERTHQLEYLNKELDAFAYTVSHDLKSPLRAIDGFMRLLEEQLQDRLTPDDTHLVQRVLSSVARMNSLITDLLSLARVSQGQLQRMSVDLSELAESVMRQERHRDPTREVEVVIAPGLTADCDARLAHIVLENLLGNALKYSRGTAQARIEFGPAPTSAGEPQQFFIRDNGAGFDMSRADRLFKPFTRLHSPSEFEGTGIGLATVRRIIERHGGQIHAKGEVGQGATFWFSFGRPGDSV